MVATWTLTADRGYVTSTGRPPRIALPTIPVDPPLTVDIISRVHGVAAPSVPPTSLKHPGVLHGTAQLNYVAAELAAVGGNPSKVGWAAMLAGRCNLPNSSTNGRLWSDLTWTPAPRRVVGRGANGSPSEGDQDELADSIAAYCHALIWAYTGVRASAVLATRIMNAWATGPYAVQTHLFDTATYPEGGVLSGWTGGMWPRPAEIIRYTFTPTGSEPWFDADGFAGMLRRTVFPNVRNGWASGGAAWLMSMAAGHITSAVYCDDHAEIAAGLTNFRAWLPSAIWMPGDVNRWPLLTGLPISPTGTIYDQPTQTRDGFVAYWGAPVGDPPWVAGLSSSTGRDPTHVGMTIASISNACETMRLQGVDLWSEAETRIAAAMELNASYFHAAFIDGNVTPVGWPFTQPVNTSIIDGVHRVTWRAGYNHYAGRLGMVLPNTAALITDFVEPATVVAIPPSAFEGLTFPGTP